MRLVLFFSVSDLSDNSEVACAIFGFETQAVHKKESLKRSDIAFWEHWAVKERRARLALVLLHV